METTSFLTLWEEKKFQDKEELDEREISAVEREWKIQCLLNYDLCI